MKIKLEPKWFKKLIEAGMIYKGKPLIDPLVVQFDKDGAIIADTFSQVVAIHMVMNKKFFLSYESEKEVVPIPSIVLERLSWGFSDNEINISTKEDKLFLKGTHDNYDTELEDIEPRPFPQAMKKTDYGMLPEKMEVKSAFTLDARELQLPGADEYIFEYKDKKLTVSISKDGNFSRVLRGKGIGDGTVRLRLDGDYFNSIASNLEGDVTFILDPDMAVFAEKHTNGFTKTFLLAPKIEEA